MEQNRAAVHWTVVRLVSGTSSGATSTSGTSGTGTSSNTSGTRNTSSTSGKSGGIFHSRDVEESTI